MSSLAVVYSAFIIKLFLMSEAIQSKLNTNLYFALSLFRIFSIIRSFSFYVINVYKIRDHHHPNMNEDFDVITSIKPMESMEFIY